MSEKTLLPIRLAGVPEPFNLPFMLGLERRAFVRAGLEVKWRTVPQGTGEMCRLLRGGEVDMAILVTEGAVRDIANGSPVRILGPLVDTPLTWGVHVGLWPGLDASDDLKGVPYAVSRLNSGSHLMAMVHARRNGWAPEPKDLIIVNDLKGAVERLGSKEPAVFLWEKYMTAALVRDGRLRRVGEFNPGWPAFVVVVRDAFLAEHPTGVDLLLRVFRDQARGLMQKKSAPEMIAQRYGMGLEDATTWFGEVKWNVDGAMDAGIIQRVGEVLHGVGLLDSTITAEAVAGMRAQLRPTK
ncbi:MAG: ABC transporter substrate-binding protein [Flavobacteriales bacterium]|nr:ABC transporter substrate-binding protein [Flavobacteriales bacterium]